MNNRKKKDKTSPYLFILDEKMGKKSIQRKNTHSDERKHYHYIIILVQSSFKSFHTRDPYLIIFIL